MNVKLLAALAATMGAVNLFAGQYQKVRISNVDEVLAKYTATTNGMAKNKIPFVNHNLVWPEAQLREEARCAKLDADLEERQEAWDKADPKTRSPWRPRKAIRKMVVEPTDTVGLKVPKTGVYNQRLEFPVEIKRAGNYTFWIKHWRNEDMHTALEFLLRNPNTECVNYTLIDRIADMWTDKDAPGRKFRSGKPQGWVWSKVTVGIEYPGKYIVNLSRNTRYVQRGMDIGSNIFAVAECWATNDPKADPSKGPIKESDVEFKIIVPKGGFKAATHHKPHVMLNSSIEDPTKRPPNQFMECYSWFMDPVRYLKSGATDGLWCGTYEDPKTGWKIGNLNAFESGSIYYGASFRGNVDSSGANSKILAQKYPFDPSKPIGPGNEPIGRAQRSDGSWTKDFSDSFQEFLDMCYETNKVRVAKLLKEHPGADKIWAWWTAWEQCGMYDYGPTSCEGYRKYLKKLYGTIEGLNKEWRTEYKSFEEIKPSYWKNIYGNERFTNPGEWHRAVANFIDFRDFCSKAYATRIYQKTRAYREMDPKRTHITSNLSANNLSSVMWMHWRPLNFEDTCQITQKGSDMIGYDNYGTDDLYGATWELYYAFGDGKLRPMIREGAIHGASPELQSRSQWHNIAKGMPGQACFCVQEANVGELSKFGMTDMFNGATPRPKIAAFSDNMRAIYQMEYLISETERRRAVKPIAIYYSAVSHLMTEKPYASIFDCGPDNFFRVYELFHANGYDVTFVTDRQIREGGDWLKSLQAIVFVDASYIPSDVQKKVVDWVVKDGGSILADAQSGSLDGHGYPTDYFTKFLGIQPVQKKKVDENAAERLSFGYSAYAFDVIDRDELYKTSCEIKDAPGSEHPISKKLVKTMVSAMGYNEVKNIKGTQVLQENNGRPYMTVREEGKGKVSYFAGYLGTMYGAGCTRFEWTDTHSDNSPYRIVDAWAEWVGAEKICETDIKDDRKYALRFESPLVDKKGNAMLGMVSQLRGQMDSFRVKYKMPKEFKAPKMVLATRNSTREIVKVPFHYDENTRELTLRMPSFRCWVNALALNDIDPFVSVEAVKPKRDAYSLVWYKPGDTVTYRVKVFNPSGKALKGGEVELRLPDGWFCNKEKITIDEIPAYGESEALNFKVKAPSFNSCRKLEPINFIYRGNRSKFIGSTPVKSSPAVEMVWFQTEPQNEPEKEFKVK